MEVLGGTGEIDSFSVLPRLYRDMMVLESWEGTHNVLCLQVWRDILRYHVHEPYFRYLRAQLAPVTAPILADSRKIVERALTQAEQLIARLAAMSELSDMAAQGHVRRLADLLATSGQAVFLLSEPQCERDRPIPSHKPDLCTHFVSSQFP